MAAEASSLGYAEDRSEIRLSIMRAAAERADLSHYRISRYPSVTSCSSAAVEATYLGPGRSARQHHSHQRSRRRDAEPAD
jgi:hypothetical protein